MRKGQGNDNGIMKKKRSYKKIRYTRQYEYMYALKVVRSNHDIY